MDTLLTGRALHAEHHWRGAGAALYPAGVWPHRRHDTSAGPLFELGPEGCPFPRPSAENAMPGVPRAHRAGRAQLRASILHEWSRRGSADSEAARPAPPRARRHLRRGLGGRHLPASQPPRHPRQAGQLAARGPAGRDSAGSGP